ncbi:hypothetical protein R5R35_011956 [Gryllus longicercus]|uniref:HAT C-terminal dimerisation domain-containing protein n=1 Tax=Gryllus longicercus TaxID=2509291 RepID=A0AAN9VR95_9ORTH
MEKSGTTEYVIRRKGQRNVRLVSLDYGNSANVQLTAAEEFRVKSYLPVIDQLLVSLDQRVSAYEIISSRFGFLSKLGNLSSDEIIKHATNLSTIYVDDVDENLGIELIQFKEFINQFIQDESKSALSREHFMYNLIIEKRIQDAFPNVEIILRIYLVLMITNCTTERSFSKLKLLKNRLRTSMTEERLNYLSILNINFDILKELSFDDVIEEFAYRKARKVPVV